MKDQNLIRKGLSTLTIEKYTLGTSELITMEDVDVKSSKLENIIEEVITAYNRLQSGQSVNAKEIIRTAKTLEHGEKRLKKEYLKRLKQLEDLKQEIDVITDLGNSLGYNFLEVDEDDQDDQEYQDDQESINEIKVNGLNLK